MLIVQVIEMEIYYSYDVKRGVKRTYRGAAGGALLFIVGGRSCSFP